MTGRLPLCPWSAVLSGFALITLRAQPPAIKIEVVAEEGAFKKLRFNGAHESWFPSTARINLEMWNEYLSVFWEHPANFHYYMGHGPSVQPGDVVIDCGCCEGFFVHQALALNAAKVVCVEPNPALVCCLEKTFAREISAGIVEIKPVALGAFQGRAAFGFDADFPSFGQFGVPANTRMVVVETLAAICDELNLDKVDFIKMDVEGAEIQAIQGGLPILRKYHPKVAVTTYHNSFDCACLRAMLCSVGYRDFRVVGITEFAQSRQYRPVMIHAR